MPVLSAPVVDPRIAAPVPQRPRPPAGAARDRTRRDDRLFARYRQSGARAERDALVERFLPLAYSVAQRFERPGQPSDDLRQVAALGLVKAVDRFDSNRSVAFSSFAVPTISGELKRYLRDRTWMVRPPRHLLENSLRIQRAATDFVSTHGRSATVAELTELTGIDESDVLEGLTARHAAIAQSLDAPVGGAVGEEDTSLGERLGDSDEGFEHAEHRAYLGRLERALDTRQREVLRMRFQEDMTQAEIGEILGVTQMQISRIVRDSLQRMRLVADADADV